MTIYTYASITETIEVVIRESWLLPSSSNNATLGWSTLFG